MKYILMLFLFISSAAAASETPCERLLRGGYAGLNSLEAGSLARLITNMPDTPFASPNYSIVLFRLKLGHWFPMQSLAQIQDAARTSGVMMPNELIPFVLDRDNPTLNITVVGTPEKLRVFLESLRTLQLEEGMQAGLGVHEANMVFVRNELAPQIIDLDRETLDSVLQQIADPTVDKMHMVNKPSSGHFFVALSPQRLNEFIQAIPQDYKQRSSAKEIESVDVSALTPESFTQALSRLQKGETQIALVQGDKTVAMLISVFDLATFQKIHAQQVSRLDVPLIRLASDEIEGMLNLAALGLPPPPPPLPSASARSASVSQVFTKGIFREFYTPGGEYELSLERPSLIVKSRSRLAGYILSADAVALLTIDQIRALYHQDTGQQLPETATHAMSEYKAGRNHINRGLHGQLWTVTGQEVFNSVRESKKPFLIVGEIGERTIKPGARPRFFILPVDDGSRESDEFEPEVETAPDEDVEAEFPELLWEDVITHFMVGEPIATAEDKVQVLQALLTSLEAEPSRLTVAQYALAKEWSSARASLSLEGYPINLVSIVNLITDRFLEYEGGEAKSKSASKKTAIPIQDLFGLLRDPEAAREDAAYTLVTQKQETFKVKIERQVLRDVFQDKALQRSLLPAFIRALRKGFVGPTERSGIKRLTNLAQNFLEVKIPGSMSQARLIGCLEEGPTIRLHRLIYKGGSSSGGFERYKNICGEN